MKFDKNYNYRNIFNNIRSSSSYHGYVIGRFEWPESMATKHWTRSVAGTEANRPRVFSIHLIPKMLLGKTKK